MWIPLYQERDLLSAQLTAEREAWKREAQTWQNLTDVQRVEASRTQCEGTYTYTCLLCIVAVLSPRLDTAIITQCWSFSLTFSGPIFLGFRVCAHAIFYSLSRCFN